MSTRFVFIIDTSDTRVCSSVYDITTMVRVFRSVMINPFRLNLFSGVFFRLLQQSQEGGCRGCRGCGGRERWERVVGCLQEGC